MNADALSRDLGQQVQEAVRLCKLGLGGREPGQQGLLEFKTLSGACLRVSIGVKHSPYGPVGFGYEPQDYGCDDQEELRERVIGVLTQHGLSYSGHSDGSGRAISWLRYMSPSALIR